MKEIFTDEWVEDLDKRIGRVFDAVKGFKKDIEKLYEDYNICIPDNPEGLHKKVDSDST